MAGNVFINYRRGDEPAAAGRLFDHLERSFPPERLFLDVDSIAPGLDFVKELEIKVEACDVLLAVIGQNWLRATDANSALRLQDPKDFVHIEIATALRLDKRVIPVLVNDAQMPRTEDLPEALKPLAFRNAVRLTHERFRSDAQGLVKAIEAAVAETKAEREAAEAATAARRAEQQVQVERERTRLQVLARADLAKAEELANWDFIKSATSIDDYRDHLARFPAGVTQRMARARLEQLVWQGLGPTPEAEAMQAFLTEFPAGAHADAARARLELPGGATETRPPPAASDGQTRGPNSDARTPSRRIVLVGGSAAAVTAAVAGAAVLLRAPAPGPNRVADSPVKTPGSDKPRIVPPTAAADPSPPQPPTPDASPDSRAARTYHLGSPVAALAVVGADGRVLAGTVARGLQLWDTSAGRLLESFGDPVKAIRAVAVADGRTVVSVNSDDSLSLWNIADARTESPRAAGSARAIRTFRRSAGDAALAVALTPDGTLALCGSTDATLEVWDTATGRLVRRLVGQSDQVTCVASAADGRTAASGSSDSTVRLWELATGATQQEFKGHQGPVRAVAISLDGRLVLSAGEDRTLRLWETASGRAVRIFRGHAAAVSCVAFTANGRHCVSGSADTTVRLWDVHNGRPIHTFEGSAGPISGLGVLAGVDAAAIAGTDQGALQVWPIAGFCRRPR